MGILEAARRMGFAAALAIGMVGGSPATAWAALPYDGTNPVTTPYGDGSHAILTLSKATIYAGTTAIGLVELRHSPYCATVWTRVTNLTASTVSVREKLVTYPSPNGGTATTYTETDTLSPKGGATDQGWSHQYRDRPSFISRGEILWKGTWQPPAVTVRAVMYAQWDGNYPDWPWTCDDTDGNICHRWPTNANGSPVTLTYFFDGSLAGMPSTLKPAVRTVLAAFSALPGGSPTMAEAITAAGADVLYYAYDGSNEGNVYARSWSYPQDAYPQYYYYGFTKFNLHGPPVTDWKPLTCHEFDHVLGIMDMIYSGQAASRALCVSETAANPQIDDQQALGLMYSTPLKGQ